jgi:4-azaleucine resistance transporter AzlC
MRTFERTILRDAATIALAAAMVGVSFGVVAAGKGIPFVKTQVMSLTVFAGGSQFVLVGGVGSGIAAALLAGLLLNARHIAFGLSLAPILEGSIGKRAIAGQLVIDESTAYALGQPSPQLARQAFWAVGGLLFVSWQLGTAVGAIAGEAIDYKAFGVDAAFPAGLLAMLGPQLDTPASRRAAILGATIAVAATPLVPRGGPLLLAGVGAAIAFGIGRAGRRAA